MRRHILGAMLMGTGGVLAQGCTNRPGLECSERAVHVRTDVSRSRRGRRARGLWHLIEGQSLWRLGRRSP